MQVSFRFNSRRVQIVLEPTNLIDESNLATACMFGSKPMGIKLGSGKEVIIESELIAGENEKDKETRATQRGQDALS